MEVKAKIARDASGVHRVFCQRAPKKWWFELGKHEETDKAFESCLEAGKVRWYKEIIDPGRLF